MLKTFTHDNELKGGTMCLPYCSSLVRLYYVETKQKMNNLFGFRRMCPKTSEGTSPHHTKNKELNDWFAWLRPATHGLSQSKSQLYLSVHPE